MSDDLCMTPESVVRALIAERDALRERVAELERERDAIERATIERAAAVCERNADPCRGSRYLIPGAVVGDECAKEIRALAPNQPSQLVGEV